MLDKNKYKANSWSGKRRYKTKSYPFFSAWSKASSLFRFDSSVFNTNSKKGTITNANKSGNKIKNPPLTKPIIVKTGMKSAIRYFDPFKFICFDSAKLLKIKAAKFPNEFNTKKTL